jgi:hypothetical protein
MPVLHAFTIKQFMCFEDINVGTIQLGNSKYDIPLCRVVTDLLVKSMIKNLVLAK